ncbi:alpha/beta hydrolase [Hirsutella rhossiliensis]|uniref:Alpha/beta hydrolase domain-containing protein n=1 Tax=Hirsutella rhossiliensis TaxID=111463 RepID=A0A9P8SFN9_9HYPO|nr:alpha/beta hydrolase domain-containing protein [Hirsutella rhossiliensis]KAH0961128.1 alpha/beta hydrolase domain-containing protein [Hirsutella rhossiliensis]
MASGLLDPSWAPTSHAASRDARHDEPEHLSDDGAMSPVTILSGGRNVRGGDGGRSPRKLVLCFDGTGNKFHGDESDSNILKIFRMLDRTAGDQYHYYQPGIGTYVVSGSLDHTGFRARLKSWYTKAKDSAVGSSFDQHVVGGYRFLMRLYNPGDEIYMFGFSRGAYIARFLAEMLDHIGLLSHGNEEMVKFAWKAFAQWQSRRQSSMSEAAAAADDDGDGDNDKAQEAARQARKMHSYMKGFRETFSRPVGRIRFLGLFDTVNSVPRFETAWMQRSKFPYTARSSARVIRHAVSIDERRAKFRQDLMYQSASSARHRHHHHHRRHMEQLLEPFRRSLDLGRPHSTHRPRASSTAGRDKDNHLSAGDTARPQQQPPSTLSPCKPYRPRSRSRRLSVAEEVDAMSCASGGGPTSDAGRDDYDDDGEQDVDEIWFAGGHGDVGGGWEALDGRKSASHVPLAWIVREAIKAGLPFDMDKVSELGCMWDAAEQFRAPTQATKTSRRPPSAAEKPDIRVNDEHNGLQASPLAGQSSPETDNKEFGGGDGCGHTSHFHDLMHRAHTSRIHDSLVYGGGLGTMAVTAWNLMEFLPFRRMDLQADGSWKPIRWPLPRGEVRDIPSNVRVHGSVIRRLKEDETYRPGNLIIGGGGRGIRRAPAEYGTGDWVCVAEHGDPIGEIGEYRKEAEKIGPE